MQAPLPVVTEEIRIVDDAGRPRIVLSTKGDGPSVVLMNRDASPALSVRLDKNDRPSVKLNSPDANAPTSALEIDDKGAHIKFDRPGGATSYLFLNNAGASGVVLIDASGHQRASVVMGADGTISVQGADKSKTKPF